MVNPFDDDFEDDDWFDDDDQYDDHPPGDCHECEGSGIMFRDFMFVLKRWDEADDTCHKVRCPCCGGSGLAKDCTYW